MNKTILDLMDNNKLIKLENNLFVLCEFLNPSGSIKDKVARLMIEDGFEKKLIGKDTTIIEATSGNMGISLAMVCNFYNLKLILTMPSNMSLERIKVLKYLNAKVILTDKSLGMQGALDEAVKISQEIKNSFMPMQFSNYNSILAHYSKTAMDIINSNLKLDIFVCGFGSSGTICGVGKRLKEKNGDTLIIAMEPQESPLLSSGYSGNHQISGIGANFIPDILDKGIIDEIITVSSSEAIAYTKILAKKYGLLVGISSGANFCAMQKLHKIYPDKIIVSVLPDSLFRYLTTSLLEE